MLRLSAKTDLYKMTYPTAYGLSHHHHYKTTTDDNMVLKIRPAEASQATTSLVKTCAKIQMAAIETTTFDTTERMLCPPDWYWPPKRTLLTLASLTKQLAINTDLQQTILPQPEE